MHSPYRPGAGVMPPFLAGRSEEIRRAEALLARTEHYGTPAQAPLILTGHRGLGKTVTLQAIAAKARQRGFATTHLTVDRHTSLAQRLAAGVAEAVAAALGKSLSRAGRRWKDRLGAFSVKVSVAGVVSVGGSVDPKDAPVDRDALRDLLLEAAELVRSHGKKGLLVTFDELQEGTEASLVVLTGVLQDVLGDDRAPVVVVGAGLPNTPERLMGAGSFAERFTYRPLSRLTAEEATEALLNPASAVGVLWSAGAAELVLEAAQGSPFLVQLYGNSTWAYADPAPGDRLEVSDAESGVAAGRVELRNGLFRGRWNRATVAEQRLLVAVAQTLSESGVARTSDVTARLGMTSPQISSQRASLIDKGLLYAPGHGQLAFTMPGFEEYVRDAATGGSGA